MFALVPAIGWALLNCETIRHSAEPNAESALFAAVPKGLILRRSQTVDSTGITLAVRRVSEGTGSEPPAGKLDASHMKRKVAALPSLKAGRSGINDRRGFSTYTLNNHTVLRVQCCLKKRLQNVRASRQIVERNWYSLGKMKIPRQTKKGKPH
jgi:hypothetical protein